ARSGARDHLGYRRDADASGDKAQNRGVVVVVKGDFRLEPGGVARRDETPGIRAGGRGAQHPALTGEILQRRPLASSVRMALWQRDQHRLVEQMDGVDIRKLRVRIVVAERQLELACA